MIIPRSPEPEMAPLACLQAQRVDFKMGDDDAMDMLSPEEQNTYKMLHAKMARRLVTSFK